MDLVTLAAAKKYADKVAEGTGSSAPVPTRVSQLENDSGFVGGAELASAVNTALAEAKASGDFKGDPGATGVNGADGKSAYQIWLDSGNTGDEAAFLASLKGAKGDTGATGAAGAKGDKGETGATGAAGKDGANGKDGTNGKDGKSVTAIALTTDAEGKVTSGIVTFSDGTTADITVTQTSE